MYRFALTPRWIAGHVLALVLIVGFIAAGFWQLSRHQWRADLNRNVEARSALSPLTGADLATADPDDTEYRSVLFSGSWLGEPLAVRNRSSNGQSGCHVLGLLQPDGQSFAVVVNRGWIDLASCEAVDRTPVAPPADRAEVLGRIRASQQRGRWGSTDPSEGVLTTLNRVDVPRIAQQSDVELAPVYVEVVDTAPPDPAARLLAPPPLDPGPHMAYAVQWFAFAAVGLVGYPLVLRWQARSKGVVGAAPDQRAS